MSRQGRYLALGASNSTLKYGKSACVPTVHQPTVNKLGICSVNGGIYIEAHCLLFGLLVVPVVCDSVFQYGECYLQVTSILGSNYPQELAVMKR